MKQKQQQRKKRRNTVYRAGTGTAALPTVHQKVYRIVAVVGTPEQRENQIALRIKKNKARKYV